MIGSVRCSFHQNFVKRLTFVRFLCDVTKLRRGRQMPAGKIALYENPLPEEVEYLRKKFPQPQQLVDEVLSSVVAVDPTVVPQKTTVPLMPFTPWETWKVSLHSKWPVKFKVAGKSSRVELAEENAYLLACAMLSDLGLVDSNGQPLDYKETFYELLENVSHKAFTMQKINVTSTRYTGINGCLWKTVIDCTWPCDIQEVAYGKTQEESERNATMHICVKLKSLKILDKRNRICNPVVMRLSNLTLESDIDNIQCDYEFYVDASVKGFGGYLLTMKTELHENPILWIKEPWPDNVLHSYTRPFIPTTFLEFYSIVATVYTWKRKFMNKNVLCWCDNQTAVDIVNKGLFMSAPAKRNKYFKLFQLLRDTCVKYNITLVARHVSRIENVAADSLSRFDVEAFRAMYPNAMYKATKTKKLLFLSRLIPKSPNDDSGKDL